jgi:putative Ca2+/H+ antiporter (TMEM165/GDT1 family)
MGAMFQSFSLVAISEMGDKTQILSLSLFCATESPGPSYWQSYLRP